MISETDMLHLAPWHEAFLCSEARISLATSLDFCGPKPAALRFLGPGSRIPL